MVTGEISNVWVLRVLLVFGVLVISTPNWLACFATPTAAIEYSIETEVSAALYRASLTQAALDRQTDAIIRSLRDEIDQLQSRVSAGEALQTELAAKEQAIIEKLSERDRAYAQEISVFRNAVKDIASTPEGLRALAMFNNGLELEALEILDDLRAARDEARQTRISIESAAEARRIAVLALEARNQGKLKTEDVIARFEEVSRLDPAVYWDWMELVRLYTDAGDLPKTEAAAEQLALLATSERNRSIAFITQGKVQHARGDLDAAYSSYQAGLSRLVRLAAAEPRSARRQHDLWVSYERLGNLYVALGDDDSALSSYMETLAIAERLVASDPDNAEWLWSVAVSNERIGNWHFERGDAASALGYYQSSAAIMEGLTVADPDNSRFQRDLAVYYDKLGDAGMKAGEHGLALENYETSLSVSRRLSTSDPSNAMWRRDLALAHSKIGNVLEANGEQTAALERYRTGLSISERLAASDPSNAEWQRDLVLFNLKLGEASNEIRYYVEALKIAEQMRKLGILAPRDTWILDDLERRIEELEQ